MNYIIIPAAADSLDLGYNHQMTPIRGKPALAWVVEQFYDKNYKIVLVLNKQNHIASKYIALRYPNVQICLVDENKEIENTGCFSILNSLYCGISSIKADADLVKIVLGDTLCRGYEENNKDMVLISDNFISSERWCLVDIENGYIKKIYDKISNIDILNKKALVGYYQFTNIDYLKNITLNAIKNKKKDLSDILIEYNKQYPILCLPVENWFDFGHKAGIINAQNKFFNSRDFNSLLADPIHSTITKISSKIQKLQDEYTWYLNIPDELKVLAPRPVKYEESIETASLTMEMYGYPALSELFILGNLKIEEWELIIERLFEVHKLFEQHSGNLDKDNFYDLYLHKTWQRLRDLRLQNPYWETLWNYDIININGVNYKNIKNYEIKLNDAIENLVKTAKVTVMHGDYCFSNILFDTNSFLCKFIDPRGRLHEQTIYGDCRYDIAKLRHSVVGGYDYAVHGLYKLEENTNKFVVTNNYPEFQKLLEARFDELTVKFGYDNKEIKLIEALLFTSMIPLHKDSIQRQKLFYCKAVKKINELFEE